MCFQRPDKSIIRQWSWHELSDSARHDAGTLPIRSVSAGNLNWNRNIKTKKEIRLIFHHVPTFQSSCCGWAPSSFSGKSIKNKSLSTVGHTIFAQCFADNNNNKVYTAFWLLYWSYASHDARGWNYILYPKSDSSRHKVVSRDLHKCTVFCLHTLTYTSTSCPPHLKKNK